MKRITAKFLLDLGAMPDCNDLETFRAEWPRGCAVNEKNANRALELGLDVRWLAKKVLPDASHAKARDACSEARDAYNKAWVAYSTAWVAYSTAWVAYSTARDAYSTA